MNNKAHLILYHHTTRNIHHPVRQPLGIGKVFCLTIFKHWQTVHQLSDRAGLSRSCCCTNSGTGGLSGKYIRAESTLGAGAFKLIRFQPRRACFGRASLAKSCFYTEIYRSRVPITNLLSMQRVCERSDSGEKPARPASNLIQHQYRIYHCEDFLSPLMSRSALQGRRIALIKRIVVC